LRHQHVDRNANAELLVELLHPGAQRLRVRLALRRRLLQEIADADRHQHAVDGPARAGFLEQLQEALPGRGVDVAVALLGGIASRGVEEHRLFREPPVAVSGAADAADRLAAEPVGPGAFSRASAIAALPFLALYHRQPARAAGASAMNAIWNQRTISDSNGRKLLIEIVGPIHQTIMARARMPTTSSTQRLKISLKTPNTAFIESEAPRLRRQPTCCRPE